MKPPIVWNRLGDATQIAASVIGPAFAWTGTPAYAACKFGNGVYSNSTSNYLATATDTTFTPDLCLVDWWLDTDYGMTDGIPDDAGAHVAWEWYKDASNRIILYVDPANGFNVAVKVGNTWYNHYVTTNLTWAASTNTHIRVLYNRAGIGGGANYRQLWMNGTSIGTSAVQPASQAAVDGVFQILAATGPIWEWDGVVDNIIIADYEMTDLNTRHAERGWMNDQV